MSATPLRAWVLLKSGRRINLLGAGDYRLGRRRSRSRIGAHLPMGRTFGLGASALGRATQPDGTGAAADYGAAARRRRGVAGTAARRRGRFLVLGSERPVEASPLESSSTRSSASSNGSLRSAIGYRRGQLKHMPPTNMPTASLAASEAFHVVGSSLVEIRDHLGIQLEPLQHDPVGPPARLRPWEPWPSRLAATRFAATLRDLGSSGREK